MTGMGAAWRALAILTLARATMGIQFQSVPALADPLAAATGLGPVAMGWLIGLYLLPGIVISFAGGWLGARHGDLRIVRAGLAMMVACGVIMLVFAPVPEFVGRILAGSGAILLNVLVTKIVADLFPPERLPTAMGILISSWPIGLALALAVLPMLEGAAGLRIAMALPVLLSATCLAMIRPGATPEPAAARPATPWPDARGLVLVTLAGCVWAFYNVALIVLLAFGPSVVAGQGMGPVEASALVSV
ncbi:MAG: MFS transporter [Rhodobacteraceae bacterium]|nr:MFS transporter [Paracoccaceae bacterium]